MAKQEKGRQKMQPVNISGRQIASSFWGKAWCQHLESFSDYSNRLPRGRSYLRDGSVRHLEIDAGEIKALVKGTALYRVTISIDRLDPKLWNAIKRQCAGQIMSLLELLEGRLSNQVMKIVTERYAGLFPQPSQINLSCSCPDWAVMCKHVAAVLYGVGSRLDDQPELLFRLRQVDTTELFSPGFILPIPASNTEVLPDHQLSDIFGIELVLERPPQWTAERLNQLRQDRALSVAQLARRLKVSAAALRAWEASPGALDLSSEQQALLLSL